jgi:hypothetical protein
VKGCGSGGGRRLVEGAFGEGRLVLLYMTYYRWEGSASILSRALGFGHL